MALLRFEYPWIVESAESVAPPAEGVPRGLALPAIWSNVDNGVQVSAVVKGGAFPGEVVATVQVYVPSWERHVDVSAALDSVGVPWSRIVEDRRAYVDFVNSVALGVSRMLGGAPYLPSLP